MHPIRYSHWRRAAQVAIAAALWVVAGSGCAATPTSDSQPTHVRQALDDAAARTGLRADQLRVVKVESVTWSDGSLGCPEPDLMYPQMLMPGFRISIEADGKLLDYHADQRGTVLWCPAERAVAPVSPSRARPVAAR